MAAYIEPTLHGRDAIIKHFADSKRAHWKLYSSLDTKAPISVKLDTNKVDDSQFAFMELVDSLNPKTTYILDMFDRDNGQDKSYYKPVTSMSFTLAEPERIGATPAETPYQPAPSDSAMNGYTPAMGDHVKLIHTNAQLMAEKGIALHSLERALEEISEQENHIAVLEEEIDDLTNDDGDDEDESSIFSGLPTDIEGSIAKVITDKGSVVVDYFFGSKENGKVTATNTNIDTDSQLYAIVESLREHDPNIEEHLRRLLGIAQGMPDVFKDIMDNLDKFQEKEKTVTPEDIQDV